MLVQYGCCKSSICRRFYQTVKQKVKTKIITIIIFKFNFLLIAITRNNHVNTNDIGGHDIRKCKKEFSQI